MLRTTEVARTLILGVIAVAICLVTGCGSSSKVAASASEHDAGTAPSDASSPPSEVDAAGADGDDSDSAPSDGTSGDETPNSMHREGGGAPCGDLGCSRNLRFGSSWTVRNRI